MRNKDENPQVGISRAFFWLISVALALMVILVFSFWGCANWKLNKGHTQPQSAIYVSRFVG